MIGNKLLILQEFPCEIITEFNIEENSLDPSPILLLQIYIIRFKIKKFQEPEKRSYTVSCCERECLTMKQRYFFHILQLLENLYNMILRKLVTTVQIDTLEIFGKSYDINKFIGINVSTARYINCDYIWKM